MKKIYKNGGSIFDDTYKKLLSDAQSELERKYPGHKVEIKEVSSYRNPSTQADIVKKGNSTTDVSLHSLKAARDFQIVIDGQVSNNPKLYHEILWKNAEKQGLYHLDPKGFGAVDLGHIGVVEEDGKTTIGRLLDKYPDLKSTDEYKTLYSFLDNKIKQGSFTPKEDIVYKQLNGERFEPELWFKPMYPNNQEDNQQRSIKPIVQKQNLKQIIPSKLRVLDTKNDNYQPQLVNNLDNSTIPKDGIDKLSITSLSPLPIINSNYSPNPINIENPNIVNSTSKEDYNLDEMLLNDWKEKMVYSQIPKQNQDMKTKAINGKKLKKAEGGIQPLTPENPIPGNMNFNPESNPYANAYQPLIPQPSNNPQIPQDTSNNANGIQPINQNRTQSSFGIKGKFNTADMTARVIAGINSLLPEQRKKDNINKLQLGYNPFPQGDNTQAVFADGGVIPENWQALHSYAYQHDPNYGSQDYNHGQFATPILEQYNQANPSQAIQPSQIPDYQQYLQQQASINPNRVSAPQGLSPIDAKYGPKTQTSNLRSWDLIHNNEPVQNFGPHPEELVRAQAKLNTRSEDYGKPKEWQSNNQGNSVANIQPEIVPIQSIQRQQKSNYHTDEDTNYSIDSVREETAKDGIHIKPSHKGRFTAYKQRTGKTTEEALHSKDPHVRQMANFSRNAKKWHHAEDGYNWDIPPYPLDAENGYAYSGQMADNRVQVEGNQYKMLSPSTMEIMGKPHTEGGTNVAFGGTTIEAEKGEPLALDKFGNAVIFGNMTIPNTNTKFKQAGKDIAEQEMKVSKLQDKVTKVTSTKHSAKTSDLLSLNFASVAQDGIAQKNKSIDTQKNTLIDLQNAMLETAERRGIDPKDVSKELEAKMGISMKKGKECFNGGIIGVQSARNITNDIYRKLKADSGFRFDQEPVNYAQPQNTIPYTGINYTPESYNVAAQRNQPELTPYAGNNAYGDNVGLHPLQTPIDSWNPTLVNQLDLPPTVIPKDGLVDSDKKKVISLADRNHLRLSSIIPEISLLGQRPDQVVGQQYNPQLISPYQVSFQDRKNEAQGTFNALNKNLIGNAAATSTLATQKYNQENGINAEEFRTNQGILSGVQNQNYNTINEAQKINLQLTADQMDKQARALAATRGQKYQALASISNKYDQKRAENNNIHLIEAMSSYRFNPQSGKVEYVGDPYTFVPNSGRSPTNSDNKKVIHRDAEGNVTGTDETDFSDAYDRLQQQKARQATMKKWGGLFS